MPLAFDIIPQQQTVYNPGTVSTVAIGAASTQLAAAFACTAVLIRATVACYIAFGSNPTATSSSQYIPANVPIAFGVDPSTILAVLQVSSGGTLYVTQLN